MKYTTKPSGAKQWYLFAAVLCCSMLFLASCSDDDGDDNQPAAPSIASLSPTSGSQGTAVTITGSGFSTSTADITVKFGTQTATVTSSTATQIVTSVPSGLTPGTASLTVTIGGRESNAKEFTVTAAAPSITSFTPAQGPAGTAVTITGTNFGGQSGTVVKFGNTVATVTQASATQLVTSVPAGLAVGTYSITVTVGSETATSAQNFTVTAVPASSVYWIGNNAGQFEIMKGSPDNAGAFTSSLLYAATTDATVAGLARDRESAYIYWVEQTLNFDTFETESTIFRGDTLGSEPTVIFGPTVAVVEAMAIDYENNKLCWIDANMIWRANLDGTEPEQLFSGATFESLLAIAVNGTHIYFIETGSVVYQGLLDGTGEPVAILDASDIPAEAGTGNTLLGITATDESLFFASRPNQDQDDSEILKATIGATPTLSILYQSTDEANPLDVILGVTLDPETDYLYWINRGPSSGDNGSIYRGTSESAGVPEQLMDGISTPSGITKNPINGKSRTRTKSPVNLAF